MADGAPSLILTTIEVDLTTGKVRLKEFAGEVEKTAQSATKSLGKMDAAAKAHAAELKATAKAAQDLENQIVQSASVANGAYLTTVRAAAGLSPELTAIAVGTVAAAAGIGAVAFAANEFADAAGRVTLLRVGFENLTAASGQSADVWLDKLRPATLGMVSDVDLMRATNKALTFELPVTAEKMAILAKGAVELGRTMGIDVDTALQKVIDGIDRQAPRMLAAAGITVRAKEAYADYARQTGIAADAMDDADRRAAFLAAAIKNIQERTEDASGALPTFSDQWNVTATSTTNTKNETLDFLNVLLGGIAKMADYTDGGSAATRMLNAQADALKTLHAEQAKAPAAAPEAPMQGPDLGFSKTAANVQVEIDKATQHFDDLQRKLVVLHAMLNQALTPDQTLIVNAQITATEKQIKAIEDPMAKHRDKDLADEARYQEQLLQIAIAASGKGTQARAALEEAAVAVRFDREIQAAKARHEATDALEAAREQAQINRRNAVNDDGFRMAMASDTVLAQAHLANDALSWQARQALEEKALSDQFEIQIREYDREHRDTSALEEAYQAGIDGIERKHREARYAAAIEDSLKLNAAKQALVTAQAAGDMADAQPPVPKLFHPPSMDEERDLALKRNGIELASLNELFALEAQAREAEFARQDALLVSGDARHLALKKAFLTNELAEERKHANAVDAITRQSAAVVEMTEKQKVALAASTAQQVIAALGPVFQKHKGVAKGMAVADTALGIMQAWANESTWQAALARSAVVVATGAAEISAIDGASESGGSISAPGGGSPSYSGATVTPPGQNASATTPVVAGAATTNATPAPAITPPSPSVVATPPQATVPPATPAPQVNAAAMTPPPAFSTPFATPAAAPTIQTQRIAPQPIVINAPAGASEQAPTEIHHHYHPITVNTMDSKSLDDWLSDDRIARKFVDRTQRYVSRN